MPYSFTQRDIIIVQTGLRGVTAARVPYGFTKVSRFKFHATKSIMSIKPESKNKFKKRPLTGGGRRRRFQLAYTLFFSELASALSEQTSEDIKVSIVSGDSLSYRQLKLAAAEAIGEALCTPRYLHCRLSP